MIVVGFGLGCDRDGIRSWSLVARVLWSVRSLGSGGGQSEVGVQKMAMQRSAVNSVQPSEHRGAGPEAAYGSREGTKAVALPTAGSV